MKKTTIMAKIIKTDGTIVEVTPQNGTDWKSHATLTPLAKQDCPLWLQYD